MIYNGLVLKKTKKRATQPWTDPSKFQSELMK